jgi:putative acetyltransferase
VSCLGISRNNKIPKAIRVIARSTSDEIIQTTIARKSWIASLTLAMTCELGETCVESRIEIGDPRQPEVLVMLEDSDSYYASLYPADSNHLLDASTLAAPEVTFLVARVAERIAGFGAVVQHDAELGEIKRMYVDPAMRGRQLGRLLLSALEDCARAKRLSCLRLETGVKRSEAIALYRSAGYREIPPFGNYKPDPLSLFMEKRLI